MQDNKNIVSLDTVERALFSKISFICYAKNNLNKIDYKTEIRNSKFISVLWSIFCVQK